MSDQRDLWTYLNTVQQQLNAVNTHLEEMNRRLDELGRHEDALLTREEAAEWLGVSVRKLDELAARRKIKPTRIGRAVRYHVDALKSFVRQQTERR